MVLRSIAIVVLANSLAAQAPLATTQDAGTVRITELARPDGTQQVWEISGERLLALPPLDSKTTRLRLSLVEAIGVAEKHAAIQNPNVKSWQVINAALLPLVRRAPGSRTVTLASWYYRVQLAPEMGSPQPLFPDTKGDALRTTVVILLDGSVVEPAIVKSSPVAAGLSPLAPGTTDVYVASPGSGVVPPRPTTSPKPGYTAEAMRQRIQGVVSLQCVVNTDGRCEDVKVVQSLDNIYGLDQRAIETARQWRYTPGTLNGKPVKVQMNIQFSFNLR